MKHLQRQLLIAFAVVLVSTLVIGLVIKAFMPNDEKRIDEAISTGNASLCDKVKKLTRASGAGKELILTGAAAVKECKNYVLLGTRPEL